MQLNTFKKRIMIERNNSDILDGSCCVIWGQYFKHPDKVEKGRSLGIYTHKYPVACKRCWTSNCKYPMAEVDTYVRVHTL